MNETNGRFDSFRCGKAEVRVFANEDELARAAATDVSSRIRAIASTKSHINVMFAAGASQIAVLNALTTIQDLPWHRIVGFHMDEYAGISPDHPASFRRFLSENLTSRVSFTAFHFIDGYAPTAAACCGDYAKLLRDHPLDMCLLGIGENGHLAFNDPAEAHFSDPTDVKIVTLDQECRQQQVNERWFASLAEVPEKAITVTVPALMRIPHLFVSVPGSRKRPAMNRTMRDVISTACPATILRTHPNATIYLDRLSGRSLIAPPES